MIPDMEAIGTELFMKYRKPNISLTFISQSCLRVPEDRMQLISLS